MIFSSLAGFAVGSGPSSQGGPGAEPYPKAMSGDSSPTCLCRYVPPTRDAEHNEAARTKTISWVRLARAGRVTKFAFAGAASGIGFPAPPTPRLERSARLTSPDRRSNGPSGWFASEVALLDV